jgi:hypothetical protein
VQGASERRQTDITLGEPQRELFPREIEATARALLQVRPPLSRRQPRG